MSRLGIVLQETVFQHKDIGFSCFVIQWDGWAGSVLQYTGLYCRLRLGWERKIVLQYSLSYCKREVGLAGIVSQYNILYCDSRGSELLDCVATQGRYTANLATTRRWAGALGARAPRQALGRGVCGHVGHDTAQGAATRQVSVQAGARGTGAGPAAWACCWAGGCALGTVSLFLTRFDSVLFLSQFLDIVREPGS